VKKKAADLYDRLEARSPKAREAALMAALPKQIAHAKKRAPGFARILANVRPEKIKSRAALAALPVTRKSDLATLQAAERPLGGLNATPVEKLAKLFMSPGPFYEPEGAGRDWWRSARALYASGFRAGERVINPLA
jgi:phenylacetate-CoA ligase